MSTHPYDKGGVLPLAVTHVLNDTGQDIVVERRCLVHDQTYTTVCSGCRADEIASA